MNAIEPCNLDDIPAVADLHRKVFHHTDSPAGQLLRDYYRNVFFENPWRSDEFPSWVCRDQSRKILGFLGVIPRPMMFRDRPIQAAISHRLMIAPHNQAAFTAARLLKRFLAGPQDLSLSDGVTDEGKRIMEAAGAVTLLPYSMNWIRPIRPCAMALNLAISRQMLPRAARVASPLCRAADRLVRTVSKAAYEWNHSPNKESDADCETLLSAITRFSTPRALRPRYEPATLQWLWNKLVANRNRGAFKGFFLHTPGGKLLGCCLYYQNCQGGVEVVHLAADLTSVEAVLKNLFLRTMNDGATCAFGRLEPNFTPAFWNLQCVLKQGAWTLANAKDPAITERLLRNDIFLTGLDAELWLNSPKDFA